MRHVWIIFGAVTTMTLPAAASPVTWEFAGEITSLHDRGGLLGGAITVGDPFSGSYTFESTTQGDSIYFDAIIDISGYVGSVPFRGPIGSINSIFILNDFAAGGSGFDDYGVQVEVVVLGERSLLNIGLRDATGTMFSSSDLPTTPPPLDGLDPEFTGFSLGTTSESFGMGGGFTSLVPEPGTLVLLAVGGWSMVKRPRKAIARTIITNRR